MTKVLLTDNVSIRFKGTVNHPVDNGVTYLGLNVPLVQSDWLSAMLLIHKSHYFLLKITSVLNRIVSVLNRTIFSLHRIVFGSNTK